MSAVETLMQAEIERLRAEVEQLREYLDTAQRRASVLGDEVAGLRGALREIAQFDLWEPAGPAASRARTALAARKGEK